MVIPSSVIDRLRLKVAYITRPYPYCRTRPAPTRCHEAASVFGPDAEAASWLHDIVEDTDVTAAQLLEWGVPSIVAEAVDSVARRSAETYEELITRAAAHPLGRLVKLADNAWNITSNPVLARTDPERAASMLRDRYQPASERLLASVGLTPHSPDVVTMQATLDRHHLRLSGPASCKAEPRNDHAAGHWPLRSRCDRGAR